MRPITDRLSPMIKVLVVITMVVYAFYLFAPKEWRELLELHLAVSPRLLAGEIWQPVTALFFHVNPLGCIMDLIGLWFFGVFIERQIGTRRFLTMFFVAGVVANLVVALWAVRTGLWPLAVGCASPLMALVMAFGTIYDRTPGALFGNMGLVLEARVTAAIILGLTLLMDLAAAPWSVTVSHLVAMLIGYLMAGGRGEGIKRLWGSARAKRVRRRYQVLEGGRRGTRPEDLN